MADWLVSVHGPSFPSQHAAASAAVYGMLAFLLAPGLSWGRRTAIVSSAVVLTGSVCVSRVYLGVHWGTDVLAGASLGAALVVMAAAGTVWTRGDVRPDTAG